MTGRIKDIKLPQAFRSTSLAIMSDRKQEDNNEILTQRHYKKDGCKTDRETQQSDNIPYRSFNKTVRNTIYKCSYRQSKDKYKLYSTYLNNQISQSKVEMVTSKININGNELDESFKNLEFVDQFQVQDQQKFVNTKPVDLDFDNKVNHDKVTPMRGFYNNNSYTNFGVEEGSQMPYLVKKDEGHIKHICKTLHKQSNVEDENNDIDDKFQKSNKKNLSNTSAVLLKKIGRTNSYHQKKQSNSDFKSFRERTYHDNTNDNIGYQESTVVEQSSTQLGNQKKSETYNESILKTYASVMGKVSNRNFKNSEKIREADHQILFANYGKKIEKISEVFSRMHTNMCSCEPINDKLRSAKFQLLNLNKNYTGHGPRWKFWTEEQLSILESAGTIMYYFSENYYKWKDTVMKLEESLISTKKELNLPWSLFDREPCKDYMKKVHDQVVQQQNLWALQKHKFNTYQTQLTTLLNKNNDKQFQQEVLGKVNTLDKEFRGIQADLSKGLEQRDTLITKFALERSTLVEKIETNQKAIDNYERKYETDLSEYTLLKKRVTGIENDFYKNKEIKNMQYEEILGLRVRLKKESMNVRQQEDAVRILKSEMHDLWAERQTYNLLIEREGQFIKEEELVDRISNHYPENAKLLNIAKTNTLIKEMKGELVSKTPYIAKPSFFIFVQEKLYKKGQDSHKITPKQKQKKKIPYFMQQKSIKTDQQSESSMMNNSFTKTEDYHERWVKFDLLFMSKARAIFDSKYKDMIYTNKNQRMNTHFCEFVYSWLGQFTVDQITRNIRFRMGSEDPDELRLDFYVNLNTIYYKKIWEIYIFKIFLDEKHNEDELFFFQHCRHIQLQQPQSNRKQPSFEVITYVPMKNVEQLLQMQFPNDTDFALSFILAKIGEYKKPIDKVMSVDVYFVLRVMLEFYIHEKKKKIQKLRQIWDQYPNKNLNDPAMGICQSFVNFRLFMFQAFPWIKDNQLALVYRNSWSLGGSLVNFDSSLCIFNEEGLFTEGIRLDSITIGDEYWHTSKVQGKRFYGSTRDYFKKIIRNGESMLEFLREIIRTSGNYSWAMKLKELEELQSKDFRFDRRDHAIFHGDLMSRFVNQWLDFMKIIDVHKVTEFQYQYKNSSKHNMKLRAVNEFFVGQINFFMENSLSCMHFGGDEWKKKSILQLQRWFRKIILGRAIASFAKEK